MYVTAWGAVKNKAWRVEKQDFGKTEVMLYFAIKGNGDYFNEGDYQKNN